MSQQNALDTAFPLQVPGEHTYYGLNKIELIATSLLTGMAASLDHIPFTKTGQKDLVRDARKLAEMLLDELENPTEE